MLKIALISVVVLVVVVACYGLLLILKGYLLVRNAPRTDMFICQNGHGPLPKNALINFMGQDYCSICFHQNMRKAEKGQL